MPKKAKAAEAARYYDISISNLRKWAREGRIPASKTSGGHYLYELPELEDPIAGTDICSWCPYIIYSRVSSRKQRTDLSRQSIFLKNLYPTYSLVEDIGSGINNKRKGFQASLEQLFQGNIKRVVVAHSDRFSRFGFDFFQWMFSKFGAVLDSVENATKGTADDLVEDVMEVLTVFTARYYGSRKYLHRNKKGETDSEQNSEDSSSEMSS